MKLLLFDDYKLGVLSGDQVIDASAATAGLGHHSPQEMMQMIITGWDEMQARIADAVAGQSGVPVDSVRIRPPLPRPGQLMCMAGNYLEPRKPERGEFNGFLKSPNSVIGHLETVELCPAEASVFHFEPELAIVIGKTASRVAPEAAMDCVFGYTQFIDVSSRGLPGGFFLGKSWHTFGPMGPFLVTKDEVPNANALPVKLWVNDELRHDFSTAEMDRHIPELLAELSNVLPLQPGDVVPTGTHHHGLAPVQDGDTVRLEIGGLGAPLQVTCHDPLGRNWR